MPIDVDRWIGVDYHRWHACLFYPRIDRDLAIDRTMALSLSVLLYTQEGSYVISPCALKRSRLTEGF